MKKYYFTGLLLMAVVLGIWYFKSTKEISDVNDGIDLISLSQTYKSDLYKFSIELPKDFTLDENYTYQLSPSNAISGVKFTIPESLKAGTNLSSDTYISVESLPGAINSCSAEIYLDSPISAGFMDIGERRFSVAKSNGAAAGNRYDETVFATPVDGGCIAVRYFVHYSVFENYPEGAVERFDEVFLYKLFDQIRETLTLD